MDENKKYALMWYELKGEILKYIEMGKEFELNISNNAFIKTYVKIYRLMEVMEATLKGE